jgi:chromosomal replication initiation ATPase DnaA
MRPRQLTFNLPFVESFAQEDFILSSCNQEAYQRVLNRPNWPTQILTLTGETGVGKSHLASIWADLAGARRVRAKDLDVNNLQAHFATGALLLEDATEKDASSAFFHLLNLVKEEQASLLITTKIPPAQWEMELKDLASRLRAIPCVRLENADDALLKSVYMKFFSDRQMTIESEVIDYLLTHAPRSLKKAQNLVAQLDKLSLEKGRKITKLLVSEVLANETARQ